MSERPRSRLLKRLHKMFLAMGEQPRYALMTVCYGLIGAAAAILLAEAITILFDSTIVEFAQQSPWDFALYSLLTITGTS